jgi:putative MATE family efflux protein
VLFIGNSILQAAGNTVIPMWAMLLANAINMVLDPFLIFGWLGIPAMGVAGAAWATVISQAVAAAWVVLALRRGVAGVRVQRHHWRPQLEVAWRLMRVGIPSSGQMLSRSLMSAVLMRVVAAFGTVAVAAYGIGVRFHMIVLMPAFVLGNAAATMVGQNLGAGQPGRAERAAWLAAAMDAAIMVASGLVLMVWAGPMVRVFDDNPAVVATGTAYLRITSLFHILAALSIVLGRALQGAGDTVAPMVMTIIGLWIFQVPLAIVLPRFFAVPTDGIWWSVAVTLTVHGVITAWWFGRGTWKAKQV